MAISRGLPVDMAAEQSRVYEPEAADFRELLGVGARRAWLALGVGAILFTLVSVGVMQAAPKYTATGSILIDPHRQNLTQTEPLQGAGQPDTSAVDTQVEVMRSHALAEAVVQRLKLYNDPEFNSDLNGRPANMAAPSPRALAKTTEAVEARAQMRRTGLTYVIQVAFTALSPAKATAVVNGFMDSYLARELDTKSEALDRANRDLSPNIERLRTEAEAAEAKVQDYKTSNNLLSAEGATIAEQEMSTINDQIASAKADTAEKQARLGAALSQIRSGGGGQDVGAALGSDTIHELRKREADLSTKLAQLKTDFKPDYPDVQRAQNQLDDIHAQIQQEIGRVISNLRAEAQAAVQRENSLLGSRGQAHAGLVANNRAQVGLFALQQRADATKQIYEGYLNRAKAVAAQDGLQQPDATISSPASAPLKPSSPVLRLAVAFAVVVGLAGVALSVLIAELLDRSLRSRRDVELALGMPLAGVLPEFASVAGRAARNRRVSPADYIVNQPLSSFAEAHRNIRAVLLLSTTDRSSRTIAVASAVPHEGKSLTSLCLARTLAMSGANVVLVDCDIRRRGATEMVGGGEVGLANVIEGNATLYDALVTDPMTGAWILPAGRESAASRHDLFSRVATDEVFSQLSQRFDYVILDTPPVLGVADARLLAARADQVLYVVRWNKTPRRAALAGLDILQDSGANVTGVLLGRVNIKKQAWYGYGDSSDYFHYFKNYYRLVGTGV